MYVELCECLYLYTCKYISFLAQTHTYQMTHTLYIYIYNLRNYMLSLSLIYIHNCNMNVNYVSPGKSTFKTSKKYRPSSPAQSVASSVVGIWLRWRLER